MSEEFSIGKHLTSLNLFREKDGTVEITVAGDGFLMDEWGALPEAEKQHFKVPINYAEHLVVIAAKRMEDRHRQR